jgi:hypothetical protein
MSKKCPWCKVDVYLTEIKHWWRCPECQTEFPERAFPKESTLFDHVTESPEVLAPNFVYLAMSDEYGRDYWGSSLIDGKFWRTKKEAIAATLVELERVTERETIEEEE